MDEKEEFEKWWERIGKNLSRKPAARIAWIEGRNSKADEILACDLFKGEAIKK